MFLYQPSQYKVHLNSGVPSCQAIFDWEIDMQWVTMDVPVDVDTDFSPPDEDYSNQDGLTLNGEEYYEYEYPTLGEESIKAIKQFSVGNATTRIKTFLGN